MKQPKLYQNDQGNFVVFYGKFMASYLASHQDWVPTCLFSGADLDNSFQPISGEAAWSLYRQACKELDIEPESKPESEPLKTVCNGSHYSLKYIVEEYDSTISEFTCDSCGLRVSIETPRPPTITTRHVRCSVNTGLGQYI